jgi:hypothetical protein
MAKGTPLKLVLVGPRAGQTVTLEGVKFVDGEAIVSSKNEEQIGMLEKYHNAHVEGSESHEAAVAEWADNPKAPKAAPSAPATPTTPDDKGKTKK